MFASLRVALACAVSIVGISAADAAVFDFDFNNQMYNWYPDALNDAYQGSGQLYANANGDGTYSVYGGTGTISIVDYDWSHGLFGTGVSFLYGGDWTDLPLISSTDAGYVVNSLYIAGTDGWGGVSFDNNGDGTYTSVITEIYSPVAQFHLTYVSDDSPAIPSGVPEAATWGMMLLGFGAVGAAMRRRTTVGFA
jgi:hypothetical protein